LERLGYCGLSWGIMGVNAYGSGPSATSPSTD
jgi:hypothetical protein